MANITSANAVFILTIPGLYDQGVPLQQFSTDDIFDTEAIESAEIQMGADGFMTGGYVFQAIKQTVTLQADSISVDIFEQWYGYQVTQRALLSASGTIVLQSVGKTYTLTNGYLTSYAPLPDAKRVLQARKFGLTWERINPAVA